MRIEDVALFVENGNLNGCGIFRGGRATILGDIWWAVPVQTTCTYWY